MIPSIQRIVCGFQLRDYAARTLGGMKLVFVFRRLLSKIFSLGMSNHQRSGIALLGGSAREAPTQSCTSDPAVIRNDLPGFRSCWNRP